MPIKLSLQQRLSIDKNPQLIDEIAIADIISTENQETGEMVTLWKRPAAAATPGALPPTLVIVNFAVEGEAELNHYREIVDRLKNRS